MIDNVKMTICLKISRHIYTIWKHDHVYGGGKIFTEQNILYRYVYLDEQFFVIITIYNIFFRYVVKSCN